MHGQQNVKKIVEFYSKNKFEKLVHLFGFIIRIYHDARSPERKFITMHGHLNVKYEKHNCCMMRDGVSEKKKNRFDR